MIAKYWRIRNRDARASSYVFKFKEIQLLDAIGTNITATATISGTNNYTAAVDGNVSTFWSSDTYDNYGTPTGRQYIKFIFPAPVEIGSVYVAPYAANPSTLYIEYSLDGNVWFTIATDGTDKTITARTITIPAVVPAQTAHLYWAIRVNSEVSNADSFWITEAGFLNELDAYMSPRALRGMDNGVRINGSVAARTAISDDNITTNYQFSNSQYGNAIAGLNFSNPASYAYDSLTQCGVWQMCTAPEKLEKIILDCSLGTQKPKSFVISYADSTLASPYSGLQEVFDWTDIASVDSITTWTDALWLTGLSSSDPKVVIPPPVIILSKAAGSYAVGSTVTITTSKPATVYYTLDGSEPTTASTLYSTAIALAVGSNTLKAIAIDNTDPLLISPVKSVVYFIDTIGPVITFTKPSGSNNAPNVPIYFTASETGTFYYTTNGTTPTTASPTITVGTGIYLSTSNATTTVKILGKDTFNNLGEVATAIYTLKCTAGFALPPGIYPPCRLPLTMDAGNPYVYVTSDGTTPTTSTPGVQYNGASLLLATQGLKTYKVLLRDGSYNVYSDVLSGDFTCMSAVRYWRIKFISPMSGSTLTLKNLEMHSLFNGVNVVTGANGCSVTAPAVLTGTPVSLDLFTAGSGFLATVSTATPYVIDIDMGTPRAVKEMLIDVSGSTDTTWPYQVEVHGSYNGIDWVVCSSLQGLSKTKEYSAYGVYGKALLPVYPTGGVDQFAPGIIFSHADGTYPPNTRVGFTTTESSTMYYTTDGSTPTITSAVCPSSIELTGPLDIKVIAVDTVGNVSQVYSASYGYKRDWLYWRVTPSGSTAGMKLLEWYSTPDGPNVVTAANGAIVTSSTPTSGVASLDLFNSDLCATNLVTFPQNGNVTVQMPIATEMIDFRMVCSTAVPTYFVFAVSDDGTTWKPIKTLTSTYLNADYWRTWGPPGMSASYQMYFRMYTITDTTPVPVLAYTNADGTFTPATLVNITRSKPSRVFWTTNVGTTVPNAPYDAGSSGSTLPLSKSTNFTVSAIAYDLAGRSSAVLTKYFAFTPEYRFWRIILSYNVLGASNPIAIKKFELREQMDGPNVVTTANGATVASTGGSTAVTLANFEGTPSLISATAGTNINITFPTPKIIKEWLIDVTGLATAGQRPGSVYLYYSGDGVTWTENSYSNLGVSYAPTYATTLIQKMAAREGDMRLFATKPSATYAAGTVVNFETNMPSRGLVYNTTDGAVPVLDTYGSYSNPTTNWPGATGLTLTKSRTLKLIAFNNYRNLDETDIHKSAVETFNYVIDSIAPVITFTPSTGMYAANELITLTTDESATIYYTTDGSTPTVASTVYTAPIDIANGMQIKAIAKDVYGNTSAVSTGAFSIDGGMPYVLFDKLAGDYLVNSTVAITSTLPADIYYTVDGSTPTVASTLYTAPITLDAAKTIKALAVTLSNATQSAVVSNAYTVDTILAHKFWRYTVHKVYSTGYAYTHVYGIDMRESVGGANVFITANVASVTNTQAYNNSIVTVAGNGPTGGSMIELLMSQNPAVTIEFTTPRKIKEMRLRCSTSYTNEYPDAIVTWHSDDGVTWTKMSSYSYLSTSLAADWGGNGYLTRPLLPLANRTVPTLSLQTPTGTVGYASVSTFNVTAGDYIVYTTDGTAPAVNEYGVITNGNYITTNTITVYSTMNVRAIALRRAGGAVSEEVSATWTVDNVAPTITVTPGNYGTYATGQLVTITMNEPGNIYYTTNNTTPTTASTLYTGPFPITAASTPVKILAKDLYNNQYTSGTYWFYVDTTPPVISFGFAAGAYSKFKILTMTLNESGTIRYTTDGTTPDINSTLYSSGAGVPLNYNMTLKAVAWDTSGNQSAVASRTYTIETTPPIVTFSTPIKEYYADLLSVTLSMNETGSMYYTLDGSTPTGASTLYTGPIKLTTTTTIKVIGIDMSDNTSTVYTAVYTLRPNAQIKLPTVVVADIPDLNVEPGTMMIPSDDNKVYAADAYNHVDPITEFHAGADQPLAKTKLWLDPATNVMKYNNGKDWVPLKSPTTTKDFGGF